jgi:serine/threonine-protein kinase
MATFSPGAGGPGEPAPPEDAPAPSLSDLPPDEPGTVSLSPTLASPATAAVAAPSLPAASPGRYEVLELLGQGGMGLVYKARDTQLDRLVAIKFLRGTDPEHTVRLLHEARTQARIAHPNVCRVYEAGELDGRAFIVMELVTGRRLDELAPELTVPQRLQVLRTVAEAIHEAHRLGLIHRDLKPSNILVSRTEDGRLVPVVMDFGLAREMGAGGLTQEGALLGTPAYMSPEQARGEVRRLDRRSDVYSLGATLYELVVGRPPFEGTAPLSVLYRVLHEEPPPPRTRLPALPLDLETIILQCLAKEPERRYASARALAEDLGRHLDGEPILGRRPGLGERLRRQLRRHRALAAVSGLGLFCVLLFGGLALRASLLARRERALATERTRLAQTLGQDIKEIEWFLRLAHALPLHDTGPERRLVRERMAGLAARGAELGPEGEAPVHYALGRAHLALRELERAREELLRAHGLGLDTPELHYALGRTLGELYHRKLEEIRHSGNPTWQAERRRELEREYLQPALASLERSRGLRLESPEHLAGLIALYRGQLDEAARAAEAASRASWRDEARVLAAEVERARAAQALAAGAYGPAREALGKALQHSEEAVAIARSDPWLHAAIADVWLEQAELDRREGRPEEDAQSRALAAADRAIQAAPEEALGYGRRAWALDARLRRLNARNEPLEPTLSHLLEAAGQALSRDPSEARSHSVLGYGHLFRGFAAARAGKDPLPAYEEARAAFAEALARQPSYPWGLNDLGLVHRFRGQRLQAHGGDPREEYAAAQRSYESALQLDPRYLYACANLIDVHGLRAEDALAHGRDPAGPVAEAVRTGERCLAMDANFFSARNNIAHARLMRARYLLAAGQPPGEELRGARAELEHSLRINPNQATTHLYVARAWWVEARARLGAGEDPGAAVASGLQALAEVYRRQPAFADTLLAEARLHLVAAAWARRRGLPEGAGLQRALTAARRAVSLAPAYVEAHLELARVHERLAAAQRAPAHVASGLAAVERALELSPGLAEAHALHGLLLLHSAWQSPAGHGPLLAKAEAALGRALALNPLLERVYGGARAQGLAEEVR